MGGGYEIITVVQFMQLWFNTVPSYMLTFLSTMNGAGYDLLVFV